MTSSATHETGVTVSAAATADLAVLLTTIDEFLRSAHASRALAAFLASRGVQFPGHDASILTDELSFTALSFRNRLAAADADHRQENP